MRPQVLSDLHDSHPGSVRTKQRALLTVYWPGIDNDIDNMPALPRSSSLSPQGTTDTETQTTPTVPRNCCGLYIVRTYGGLQFLIIVDCFTNWPEIILMGQNTLTHRLITALRQTFCCTAVPDTLWSDGGTQFTANAFKIFATQWRFIHRISSPRYPQSNGKIEATVKSMKKILAASWDHRHLNEDKLGRALLQYHNMPYRKDGLSPAQKLFGHPIQDTLPAHRRSFAPEWQKGTQEAEQQVTETLEQSKTFYNIHVT